MLGTNKRLQCVCKCVDGIAFLGDNDARYVRMLVNLEKKKEVIIAAQQTLKLLQNLLKLVPFFIEALVL